jgi:hypothetical protein
MLKVGERRLVMHVMLETEAKLAKLQGNAPYLKDKVLE